MSENIYDPNIDSISYAAADIKQEEGKSDALSVSDAMMMAKIGLETIRVKIIGEVSQVSNNSGYKAVYFTVKDNKSALPCLMWKNRYQSAGIDISVGSLVEIVGKFSLYAPKGRMNFDVESITLAGEGQLRLAVAKLAKKLEAAGLMSSLRKRPIPEMPIRVGVVTSPRGAVIHDIIRTLRRRSQYVTVVFAGCPVEGDKAPSQMIEALKIVDKSDVDVILLCRGGGSFEDLMPFNDENLAIAITECQHPVVTGIGHEPDTTIADMVSDVRASTPTAAAELVSINAIDEIDGLHARLDNIKRGFANRLNASSKILDNISSRPIFADGTQLFLQDFQELDYCQEKISRLLQNFSQKYDNEIKIGAAMLHDKSPLAVLSRGYSVALDKNKKIIKSVSQIQKDDLIDVALNDGKISAQVTDIDNKNSIEF